MAACFQDGSWLHISGGILGICGSAEEDKGTHKTKQVRGFGPCWPAPTDFALYRQAQMKVK
jgi:hypothetical protein